MRGATHVARCTPLVTCVIGTSSSERPATAPRHIRRETAPCSRLTPLLCAGEPQREQRHAERLARVRSRSQRPSAEEALPGLAHLADVAAEVALDQVGGEHVVAGGHGRVRGEDDAVARAVRAPLREVEPVPRRSAWRMRSRPQERRVPLVHVADGRRAGRAPSSARMPPMPEHDLLAHAHARCRRRRAGR